MIKLLKKLFFFYRPSKPKYYSAPMYDTFRHRIKLHTTLEQVTPAELIDVIGRICIIESISCDCEGEGEAIITLAPLQQQQIQFIVPPTLVTNPSCSN